MKGGGSGSVNREKNEEFSNLVEQYERLVYTICCRMLRDPSAAEDLTQETFLSAYLHLDSLPGGYEKQWLARIAMNKAKDYLESAYQRHTILPGDDTMPEGEHSPPAEDVVCSLGGEAEIAELIHQMRQPYQPVCELCLLRERTPEEAALALGRPVKTIHTQLARGKKILREEMKRRAEYETVSS